MKKYYIFLLFSLVFFSCNKEERQIIPLWRDDSADEDTRVLVLADQNEDRIRLVSPATGKDIWSWAPSEAQDIPDNRKSWFVAVDEVKPVYGCKYILFSYTSGAVGLVRISDSKLMFYACPKGYPHSVELMPDGRIVSASSSDGSAYADRLRVYDVDTTEVYASAALKEYPLKFGHNVVWDRSQELLWATANNVVNSYIYDSATGELTLKDSFDIPDGNASAHELFPHYGTTRLWLSTASKLFTFDSVSHEFKYEVAYQISDIKSVSSGPSDYSTIYIRPTTSYWSNKVLDTSGGIVFYDENAKIYKARWLIDNTFSYDPDDDIKKQ